MLTTEDMARIQNESVLGQPPSLTTPEAMAFRQQVDVEVKESVAQGFTPHAPYDMPG